MYGLLTPEKPVSSGQVRLVIVPFADIVPMVTLCQKPKSGSPSFCLWTCMYVCRYVGRHVCRDTVCMHVCMYMELGLVCRRM